MKGKTVLVTGISVLVSSHQFSNVKAVERAVIVEARAAHTICFVYNCDDLLLLNPFLHKIGVIYFSYTKI